MIQSKAHDSAGTLISIRQPARDQDQNDKPGTSPATTAKWAKASDFRPATLMSGNLRNLRVAQQKISQENSPEYVPNCQGLI